VIKQQHVVSVAAIAHGHILLIPRDSVANQPSDAPEAAKALTFKLLTMDQIAISKENQANQSLMPAIQPASSSLAQILVDGLIKSQLLAKKLDRLLTMGNYLLENALGMSMIILFLIVI
jgi:hypothetical protein